jgi:hypothetical protein
MRASDHVSVMVASVACFVLLSGGCSVGLGSLVLPTRVVPRKIVEEHQTARIDSEPRGAEVVEDEAVLGKTPARIDLSYQEEPHEREARACWAFVPLAVVDLAIAAAGVWASYAYLYNSEAGKSVCAFGEEHKSCMPAVAVVGMIASGVYAWSAVKAAREQLSSDCYVGGAPSRIIPRRHALRLKKDGWEEKLDLEAPRPPHSADIKILFLAKEAADWKEALASDTQKAFRRYLADYPSGRWRKEAAERIEALAWQDAGRAGTALSYWKYLTRYPSGRWQKDAEREMTAAAEKDADVLRWKALAEMLLGESDVARSLAITVSLQRNSVGDLRALLSDRSLPAKKRQMVVDALGRAVASPFEAPRARAALCAVAAMPRFVPEHVLQVTVFRPRVQVGNTLVSSPDWLNFMAREFVQLPDREKLRLLDKCKEEAPPSITGVIYRWGKVIETSPCAKLRASGHSSWEYDECWARYQAERQGLCQKDARRTAERIFEPENEIMERARRAGQCGE